MRSAAPVKLCAGNMKNKDKDVTKESRVFKLEPSSFACGIVTLIHMTSDT